MLLTLLSKLGRCPPKRLQVQNSGQHHHRKPRHSERPLQRLECTSIAERLVRELAHIFKNDRKTCARKLIELPN